MITTNLRKEQIRSFLKFVVIFMCMKTDGAVVKESMKQPPKNYWWRQTGAAACAAPAPKPGDCCPTCGEGVLAYDGLFVLSCTTCGKAAESGAFT